MLHPFREGNGRAQRLLFEQLVIAAEYPIDWRPISPDEWVHANISAVACNYAPLADIFDRCIGQAPFSA
ncbi:Protein involved in cell division [Pseudomonas sp. URIL14HWK12:I9]|nr:cell filamentation protein [Pseudomonas sp. URIL14HWK12:I12]PVZ25743.1 cell filamentation protein [Pseudomonas sp. URIL14HWK12:I10]PVZ36733.1 cell filamentation protein [Pseudomonas sp. URIL14HWK12:I11]SNZ12722.1 Protein involved in cell division [Pseudomonas sp. URIL14HWK12:I9]